MASVVIGRVGTTVTVDTGVCVKTGRPTTQQVTISGATTPGWVDWLVIFSFLSWLFATGGTSRCYRIDVPFLHEVHDRWRRRNRLAWLVGAGGFVQAVVSVVSGKELAGLFLGMSAAGLTLGVANALIDNVGVRQNRAGELVLTRVHQSAVDVIAGAKARSTDCRAVRAYRSSRRTA